MNRPGAPVPTASYAEDFNALLAAARFDWWRTDQITSANFPGESLGRPSGYTTVARRLPRTGQVEWTWSQIQDVIRDWGIPVATAADGLRHAAEHPEDQLEGGLIICPGSVSADGGMLTLSCYIAPTKLRSAQFYFVGGVWSPDLRILVQVPSLDERLVGLGFRLEGMTLRHDGDCANCSFAELPNGYAVTTPNDEVITALGVTSLNLKRMSVTGPDAVGIEL